jgi:hypothetical protein
MPDRSVCLSQEAYVCICIGHASATRFIALWVMQGSRLRMWRVSDDLPILLQRMHPFLGRGGWRDFLVFWDASNGPSFKFPFCCFRCYQTLHLAGRNISEGCSASSFRFPHSPLKMYKPLLFPIRATCPAHLKSPTDPDIKWLPITLHVLDLQL